MFTDSDFLLINGDSYLDCNIDELISFHHRQQSMATMALVSVEDASRYGSVELDSNGSVVKFMEKGREEKGLINGGILICNHKLIDHIPDGKVSLESEILPKFLNNGIYGKVSKGYFIDIGIPSDYLNICQHPERLS